MPVHSGPTRSTRAVGRARCGSPDRHDPVILAHQARAQQVVDAAVADGHDAAATLLGARDAADVGTGRPGQPAPGLQQVGAPIAVPDARPRSPSRPPDPAPSAAMSSGSSSSRVGDAQAATRVEQLELRGRDARRCAPPAGQGRRHRRPAPPRRARWRRRRHGSRAARTGPAGASAPSRLQARDGLVGLLVGEAELDVAGRADDGQALGVAAGRQAQHQALARVGRGRQLDDHLELVERLDGERARRRPPAPPPARHRSCRDR